MGVVAQATGQGQTTIPKQVRAGLEIVPSDLIVSEVAPDGRAVVRRAQRWDLEHLRAVEGTLSEWTSPADEEAYRDL